MKKKRNILAVAISCLGILLVANVVLFALGIFKLWLFLAILGTDVVAVIICGFLLVNIIKKIKMMQVKNASMNKTSGNYMLDVYTLLGIPPQYNKDGTLRNIYEILQIKPVYDENGNRIFTVYELLGIKPMIDENGNEIPQVFALKNRVGRIARVSLSTEFLQRKLTPEEEEQKIIRETLEKKLQEAEQSGDAKKVGAIKKAIKGQDKKQDSKKKGSEKSVSYSAAKSKTGTSKPTQYKKEAKKRVVVSFKGNSKNSDSSSQQNNSGSTQSDPSTPSTPTATPVATGGAGAVKGGKPKKDDLEFVIDAEQEFF